MQMIQAGKKEPWTLMMGSQPAAGMHATATSEQRHHQPLRAISVAITMSEHSAGRTRAASSAVDRR
jgi:hypothetical protein